MDKQIRPSGALTKRATGSGLLHIPLEDVVLGDTSIAESSNSSAAASAKGTNDNNPGHTARLLGTLLNSGLDIGDQGILIGVARNAGERLAVRELPGPGLQSKSCSGKASVEAKRLILSQQQKDVGITYINSQLHVVLCHQQGTRGLKGCLRP